MSNQYITVGLLWHSLSSGNLGVGALTEAHIAIVTKIVESLGRKVHFIILGPNGATLPAVEQELSSKGHRLHVSVVRVFRRSFAEEVSRCDVILDIGAGDSFATIYGFKRFFYYWLSKNIVAGRKVPLVLAPQTIGPFDGALARMMARQVMRRSARVFARDQLSYEYLKTLGVENKAMLATDVAFALPYQAIRHKCGGDEECVHVGVNLSGLLYNGGYTKNNQFGLTTDYALAVKIIVAEFLKIPRVKVHLVSHVIEPHMPVEDDVAAAQLLKAEFPAVLIGPLFSRPGDAKSYIAGLDFFVGGRMHACIAAFSSGVPVVPMAYSRKFNGLFGSLGYSRMADCKVDSTQVAVDKVLNGFHSRAELKAEVRAALQGVSERLGVYERYIEDILKASVQLQSAK